MPSLNLPWLLLAATTLPEARAWTTLSQAWHGAQIGSIQIQTGPNNATDPNRAGHIANMLNYIWHEPPDISSTQGLGSGLSWAFDPEICSSSKSDLLGRFDESLFGVGLVTCESLKAAMHRAFASWAANSPRINFFDVTAKCAAWHDEANAGAAIPTTFNQCPYAEIWVTWMDVRTGAASTNNEVVSLNRRVRHLEATIPADRMVEAGVSIIESRGGVQAANEAAGAGTAALANPYPSYTSAFRFTNGNINHGDVYATTRATISFNPALCWYLDSTFCSSFHTVKATMGADAANALFSALVFSCFALGAFIFFLHFLQIAQRVLSEGFVGAAHPWKNRQTRKRFMMAVMAALKQQPMWLWGLKLTLLVCPITFYAQVLLPCFNCYDFEAAATHEIGHVLGLSHPDTDFEASLCGSSYCTQPGVNSYNVMLAAGRTWNSTTCGQP